MSGRELSKVLRSGFGTLPEGLLVATLYATLCWATRQISLDQFFLPAGIRLAALLMLPVRMWPYLLLGDYLYLGHLRIPMLDRYGPEWVFVASAYQFPIVRMNAPASIQAEISRRGLDLADAASRRLLPDARATERPRRKRGNHHQDERTHVTRRQLLHDAPPDSSSADTRDAIWAGRPAR